MGLRRGHTCDVAEGVGAGVGVDRRKGRSSRYRVPELEDDVVCAAAVLDKGPDQGLLSIFFLEMRSIWGHRKQQPLRRPSILKAFGVNYSDTRLQIYTQVLKVD